MIYDTLIEPESLRDLMQHDADLVVFDCRHQLSDPEAGRAAWRSSHISGARFAHMDEDLSGEIIPGKTGRHPLPSVTDFIAFLEQSGVQNSTQVVAYDDKGGALAARLWWMLHAIGHESAAVLSGGWPTWLAIDGPVDDEVPTVEATKYELNSASGKTFGALSAREVDQIRLDDEYRVIDSRTEERYRGIHEPIDAVAGHVPGAFNRPWPNNLDAEGRFLDTALLQQHFQDITDDTPAERTVFYCGSGVTACHNLLAYKLAFGKMAKLYAGSWSDWITDSQRLVGSINQLQPDQLHPKQQREIAAQLRLPSGDLGDFIAAKMEENNAGMYTHCEKLMRPISKQATILEVGFGGGETLGRWLEIGFENVIGFDHSMDMIAKAEKRYAEIIQDGKVSLLHGKVEEMQLPKPVAVILSINTIYFWNPAEDATQSLFDALLPGGQLLLGFRAKNRVQHIPYLKYGFHLYEPKDAVELLEKAGFADIHWEEAEDGERWSVALSATRPHDA